MKRVEQAKGDFKNALKRLEEAVREAKSDLEIDGAIQRFEFTFELFWKLLKVYLESEGIICRSPKGCLKEAYQAGIIEREDVWLKMLDDRNMSVHIYDKQTSGEIFDRIKNSYVREFKKALRNIEK
jgi:nucleotidyltransferase substrate binding protein (TIGR01987 family)